MPETNVATQIQGLAQCLTMRRMSRSLESRWLSIGKCVLEPGSALRRRVNLVVEVIKK